MLLSDWNPHPMVVDELVEIGKRMMDANEHEREQILYEYLSDKYEQFLTYSESVELINRANERIRRINNPTTDS